MERMYLMASERHLFIDELLQKISGQPVSGGPDEDYYPKYMDLLCDYRHLQLVNAGFECMGRAERDKEEVYTRGDLQIMGGDIPNYTDDEWKEIIGAQPVSGAVEPEKDERFIPPDNGDVCWQRGAKSFTRKEVAYLLYTQRAMISNDLKMFCGKEMTTDMYEILEKPRKPDY